MQKIFAMVSEHRKFFLASPLWLGALLLLLSRFGGAEVRGVLQFMVD
jgi:hypothetical protein